AGASGYSLGVEGMKAKMQAERLATRSGTRTVIACGMAPDVPLRLVRGERLGASYVPVVGHIVGRKCCTLAELSQGILRIDDGAARVLLEQGASLLPIGVCSVNGRFERGAVVQVVGEDGRVLGQGLANYSRNELERLRGHHSPEIVEI